MSCNFPPSRQTIHIKYNVYSILVYTIVYDEIFPGDKPHSPDGICVIVGQTSTM